MKIHEIKSIELGSFTTMTTAINIIFSIIATAVLSVLMFLLVPDSGSVIIYLIPTIIVGTFMFSIYSTFTCGMFYNLLSSKLKTICIAIDNDKLVKISTNETAIMTAIIATIQIILLYLVSVFILPIVLSSMMQTLMFTGQQAVAYSLYQLLIVISQPTTIIMIIFGIFIISFVFTLLGTYIYNFLAKSGRGFSLKLSKNGKLTQIDSFDKLSLAIAFAIISGILNIILAVIMIISGGNVFNALVGILSGFVGGFIELFLFALFYNYLTGKITGINFELNDFKIN